MLRGTQRAVWVMAALAFPGVAAAIDPVCPIVHDGAPSLGARPAAERLAWIRTRLDDDARRTQRWGFAWTYGYTAITAAQWVAGGIFGTVGQGGQAVDNVISGGASLVGALFMLVTWLPTGEDAAALDRQVANARAADVCVVLAQAETMLRRDAAAERLGRSWYNHLLTVGFNLGLAAVMGFGLGHWRSAVLNLVGGNILSEAQSFTEPTGARDAWGQYLQGELGPLVPPPILQWSVAPMLGPTMAGLVFRGTL